MLIAGIFLLLFAVGVVLLVFMDTDPQNRSNITITIWGTVLFLLGSILIIGYILKDSPQKKSLKEYSYRIEIKSEVINGVETSRDTVYIFTPKSKK